jgi:glycosyltransferase involved in cell wall biosynthesis
MLKFLPPKSIKRFQAYNYVPFDEVPKAELTVISDKVGKLQSEAPLISIVLIAWNEQHYILATLASLAETRSQYPIELIVVNNNSTDDTQKFIDACGFISVFETKQGYAHARQAGLEQARGTYIVTGDTDTIYQPGWVDSITKPLVEKSALCAYTLHAFYTDDQRYPFGLLMYQQVKYFGVLLKNAKRPHLNCGGASMAYSKEAAHKVGGYDVEVGRGEDGTLAFEIGKLGAIALVSKKRAMIYTNMRRTQMDGSLWKAFFKRIAYNLRYFTHYFSKQKER